MRPFWELAEKRFTPRMFYRIAWSDGGCWVWTGNIGRNGYGQIAWGSKSMKHLVHRLSYEMLVGEIPEDKQLDHLCRVRACLNPEHLEAVTPRENWERGNSPSALAARTGFCKRGHSDWISNSAGKTCRQCKNASQRELYWRQRA